MSLNSPSRQRHNLSPEEIHRISPADKFKSTPSYFVKSPCNSDRKCDDSPKLIRTPPNTPISPKSFDKPIQEICKLSSELIANESSKSNLQQFCLKWNNYQANLTNVFDQLLQNESFVDVTLACDGQSIKAHKMVLSACSPYFQALFFDNPCEHPIIIMRDVKWTDLKALIDFMYKGEINVCQDQIGPLLRLAESLKVRGLADVSNDPDGCGDIDGSFDESDLHKITKPELSVASKATKVDLTKSPEKRDKILYDRKISSVDLSSCETELKKGRFSREWNFNNLEIGSAMAHHQRQQTLLDRNRKRRWISLDNADTLQTNSDVRDDIRDQVNRNSREDNKSNRSAISTSSTPDVSHNESISSPARHSSFPSSITATSSSSSSSSQSHQTHNIQHSAVTPITTPIANFPVPPQLEAMILPPSINASSGSSASTISHIDDLEIKPGIAEMIREEERAKLMENSHAWLGTSAIADTYQYQLQSMWQKCWNQNQNLMHHLRFRERGPLKSWRPETMAEAIFSVLKEGLSLSQAARKYDIPYPTFVLYANRVHNMLGPSIDGGSDLRPKGRGRPQRILLGIWPDEHIKGVIKTVVFRDMKELKDDAGLLHMQYGRNSPVFPFQDSPIGYPCSNGLSNSQPGSSGSDSMSPEATAAAVAAVAHGLRQQMQMAAAGHHSDPTNIFLPSHLQGLNNVPKQTSPTSLSVTNINNNNERSANANSINQRVPHQLLPNSTTLNLSGLQIIPGLGSSTSCTKNSILAQSISPLPHDLRIQSPDVSPLNSPLEMTLESTGNLTAFKPSENIFHDDMSELVASEIIQRNNCNTTGCKTPPPNNIKIEPMTECRNE